MRAGMCCAGCATQARGWYASIASMLSILPHQMRGVSHRTSEPMKHTFSYASSIDGLRPLCADVVFRNDGRAMRRGAS